MIPLLIPFGGIIISSCLFFNFFYNIMYYNLNLGYWYVFYHLFLHFCVVQFKLGLWICILYLFTFLCNTI